MRETCLRIKWAWQRLTRGWDDRVAWDIDTYLSRMIPVWIGELRKTANGWPGLNAEFDGLAEAEAVAKWDGILAKIQDGFKAHLAIDECWDAETAESLFKLRDEGLALFAKWFGHLWD